MPTFLKVDLDGADVPLTFSCRFYQAESEYPCSYLSLVCVFIQNSVFNNDLSASCTLGQQSHVYSTSADKLFQNRLKW